MYESLKKKILDVAESYADLIKNRISTVADGERGDKESFDSLLEGIRILHHAVVMLAKVDRLCNGSNTGGQETPMYDCLQNKQNRYEQRISVRAGDFMKLLVLLHQIISPIIEKKNFRVLVAKEPEAEAVVFTYQSE